MARCEHIAKEAVKLLCTVQEATRKLEGFLPILKRKDNDVAEAVAEELISLHMAAASYEASCKAAGLLK